MSVVGLGVEIKNIGCPFFTEETARAELTGIRGPYHIKPHQKV